MRLGEIIKRYRKENKLTLEDFAKRCGLSKAYIGFIENGINPGTGKPLQPSVGSIRKVAAAMMIEFDELLGMIDEEVVLGDVELFSLSDKKSVSVKIPVLGRVAAGIPIEAVEEVIEYVDIPEYLTKTGSYFGLLIKGDSMTPLINDGDVVIVKKASTAVTGNIVIATTNNEDAVCKKYIKKRKTTTLQSVNPEYEDIDVSKDPDFHIWGIVTELRRKL